MIQSVWERMNTVSKYVMISTWLHIWRDEQKHSLCLLNDPVHTVVSTKCINDLITAAAIGLKCCKLVNHQVYILRDSPLASRRRSTHNQHNKYLEAVWANWQAGDWCGCKRVGRMDGTDQPDEVRKQGSRCIWPNWSPIKQGIDITQQSRPCEPPLDLSPRHVTHTLLAFTMEKIHTHTCFRRNCCT